MTMYTCIYICIQGGPKVGLQSVHYLFYLNNHILDINYKCKMSKC